MYCTSERCRFFEQKCLDIYKPWNKEVGYNMAKNALAPMEGIEVSEETKKKVSEALKKHYSNIIYHLKNISLSAKHKENIRQAALNRPLWNRGITLSQNKIEEMRKQHEEDMKPVRRISIKDSNDIKEYKSIAEAANDGPFNRGHIGSCCNKRYGFKSHKEYFWEFIEDIPTCG